MTESPRREQRRGRSGVHLLLLISTATELTHLQSSWRKPRRAAAPALEELDGKRQRLVPCWRFDLIVRFFFLSYQPSPASMSSFKPGPLCVCFSRVTPSAPIPSSEAMRGGVEPQTSPSCPLWEAEQRSGLAMFKVGTDLHSQTAWICWKDNYKTSFVHYLKVD